MLLRLAADMIGNALQYFNDRIMDKRAPQNERQRIARIFSPLWAKGNLVTLASVECLRAFRFVRHPKVAPFVQKMKNEIAAYNALVDTIPPLEERLVKDRNGKDVDSFDIRAWWLSVKEKLPGFFQVLRALLTHAPNSAPPERLFSILNNTFGDQQTRAYEDYIEFSLMKQFNERTRD